MPSFSSDSETREKIDLTVESAVSRIFSGYFVYCIRLACGQLSPSALAIQMFLLEKYCAVLYTILFTF